MSNRLYDALRAAGVDLEHAHRLDAYLRAVDETASAEFVRTLGGDRSDTARLRATLRADLEAIVTGLSLLDAAS